ncbi:unnamed protein product [Musa acuminata subsp. burmannicoides]
MKREISFKLAPFRPKDLLPLLPRRAAWPLLRSLRSAEDLLPTFVGPASSPVSDLNWKGACFYKNTAWMEFHNKSQSRFGGGILHIKVKHNGMSIFLLESGMIGTLQALWDVFPLFTNDGWVESSNLAFLKKHMGATFEGCPQPWISSINVNDIHSGDFLVISKICGRWGGFEILELVTGTYADHSVVCLKDSEGKLYIGESGPGNGKGNDIIVIPPWDEWWESELKKDESNPHIALLPLHPDMRAKFNNTAAWEYAKCMLHKPYVYHKMIFSWIDIVSGNYLPPLDAHVGLDLPDIIVEAEKRGTSCVAFILEIYKAITVSDTSELSFCAFELDVILDAKQMKDAYTLNFFESNISRLPEWYRMELPGYNSMQPYPHIMNEKCPTLPPNYVRAKYC